ncbi:MAG: HAD family phosphatase [Candidatus Thermoplasmatota archaeon]|nr:HAD family phosphatase [Candidatus Thermoplasmatota archaeon]
MKSPFTLFERIMYRIALFDMDGTLLDGRTIFHFAEKKGFQRQLHDILNTNDQPYQKSLKIARLLKGSSKNELLNLFRELPLRQHVIEVLSELRKRDMIIAIATDSYDIIAQDLQKKLNVDHVYANTLVIHEGIVTGDLLIHNKGKVIDEVTHKIYSISKSCIVDVLAEKYAVSFEDIIAVGDGLVDCGMLQKAGLGFAIHAPEEVKKYADVSIDDLRTIITHLEEKEHGY